MSHVLEAVGWIPTEAQQILLVADAFDVPMVEAILETLDAKSRGQIFIEVDDAEAIVALCPPSRFAVCWLVRDAADQPGQLLSRAADAWLSEMMTGDDEEHSILAWYASEARTRLLIG